MAFRLSASSLRRLADILIHRYPNAISATSGSPASLRPRLLTSTPNPVRTLAAGQPVRKSLEIKDEEDFLDAVMYSSDPVIVNFHADWCQPCHLLTPKLESAVGASKNVKLCNVDIGEYPELVQEFEVQAVPAVVAVKRGRIVDKFVGLVDQEKIEKFVKRLEESDGDSSTPNS